MIVFLADPSFHDGSGSAALATEHILAAKIAIKLYSKILDPD